MKTIDDELKNIKLLIKETRRKAGLLGQPYVLGLATVTRVGDLIRIIKENAELFRQEGAIKLDWREGATRGKSVICNEELIVTVDKA
jgi:hypothetical protein